MRNGSSVLKEAETQLKSVASRIMNEHTPESVQSMNREELLQLQFILGHGNQWGVWKTPRDWFPGGTSTTWEARMEERIRDLVRQRMQPDLLQKRNAQQFLRRLIDTALLSCVRYLVLCRYAPVSLRDGRHPLEPTSLATLAHQHLPVLAASSIVKAMAMAAKYTVGSESACFGRLLLDDVELMTSSLAVKDALRAELRRMHRLSTRGWWSDVPDVGMDIRKVTQVRGDAAVPLPQRRCDPHKPLPDAYVGELGQKSMWIITHLGPNILRILIGFQQIWKEAAISKISGSVITPRCTTYLKGVSWTDGDGQIIKSLPFRLRLSQHGINGRRGNKNPLGSDDNDAVSPNGDNSISTEFTTWPPTKMAQIFGLANVLQGAHLFVAGLSMGARRSETLEMARSCVTHAPDGTTFANGRTFKLVQRHDGVLRDWALPTFAEQAIEQQARLASHLERLSLIKANGVVDPDTLPVGATLWCQRRTANRTTQVTGSHIAYTLRKYAATLGLDPNPGGQPLRPHRLRKTLARLAALAIVQAPKVLQDVFGHKSIEMTLYYILANKNLSAEIDTITRELRVVRAEKIVADMVSAEGATSTMAMPNGRSDVADGDSALGGYGGLAAVTVHHAIQAKGQELYRRAMDWEADSIRDLAEVLTMNGTLWNLVRPGVICTKSIGQAGPCNKKRGHPDPTQCQSSCDHRLEEAWLRDDVDQCIKEALDLWQRETSAGQDLVAEHWAGQIRAHLGRFSDLRAKWLQDSRVRDLVAPADASESAQ